MCVQKGGAAVGTRSVGHTSSVHVCLDLPVSNIDGLSQPYTDDVCAEGGQHFVQKGGSGGNPQCWTHFECIMFASTCVSQP